MVNSSGYRKESVNNEDTFDNNSTVEERRTLTEGGLDKTMTSGETMEERKRKLRMVVLEPHCSYRHKGRDR